MMQRLFALIQSSDEPVKVKHIWKSRRGETLMPKARIILLEEGADGTMFYRYAADGNFAGDTWHSNIEEAKGQAEFEFGAALQDWKDIPEEIQNAIDFVIQRVRSAN